MPAPRSPARASERVHRSLRREILEGTLAPGDPMPSERTLAEDHGVNRHAVREALKKLEQAGLVRIAQGGPTRILDWRDSGGLELLLDLTLEPGGEPPAEVVRSALEMRESIGTDAARRCARRASDEKRAAIRAFADETAGLIRDGGDPEALDLAYADLWRMIVDGSENLAYRLALNSLMVAVADHADIASVMRPTDVASLRALGRAIDRGDAATARRAAERLLTSAP